MSNLFITAVCVCAGFAGRADGGRLVLANNATIAEPITIAGSDDGSEGGWGNAITCMANTSNTLAGLITLDGTASCRIATSAKAVLNLGPIRRSAASAGDLYLAPQGNTTIHANGHIDLNGGDLTFQSPNPMFIPGTVVLNAANNDVGAVRVHLNPILKVTVSDALAASTSLVIGNTAGNTTSGVFEDVGTVDMLGVSQSIDILAGYPNGSGNAAASDKRRITSSSSGAATLTVGIRNGSGSFDGVIENGSGGGTVALTKVGTGTLTLAGNRDNTYTGVTAVANGTLSLNKTAGTNAVSGDIVIGGGTSSTGTLQNAQNNQIADTATVTLTAATSRWLISGKSETVANVDMQKAQAYEGLGMGTPGKLTVTDTFTHTLGGIVLHSSGAGTTWISANKLVNRGGGWTFGVNSGTQSLKIGEGGLTIGGGSTINVNANAACTNFISLGGDVTSEPNTAANTISGAGRLLLNGPRAFDVADGTAALDLTVSAIIANGTAAGSITKSGLGTLSLSGTGANTYTGITAVDGGTLTLNKTAGTNAVAGDIVIGAGILRHDQNDQIADTATVTMTAATSKWLLNGKSETVANMDIQNAGAGATTGFSTGWSGKLTVTETLTHTLGNITLNSSGSGAIITADTLVNRGGTWTFGVGSGTQSLQTGPGGLTIGGGSTIALDANASCMNFIALGGDVTSEAEATVNTISGAGRLLLNGPRVFDVADGAAPVDLAVSAVIADGTGAGSITKTGPGTLSLSGANTFTGGITVNEGALAVSSLTPLPGWNTPGLYKIGNNGKLAVDNSIADGDVATILERVDFQDGAYICFDTTSGNRTYSRVIGDTASGALGVYKVGLNTLTLSGDNTYDGNTFVMLGTLYATHNHALGTASGYTAVYATGSYTNGARVAIGPNVSIAEPFLLTGPGDGNGGYSPALQSAGGGTRSVGGAITLASQGKRFRINAENGNMTLNGPVGLASGVTGCSLTHQTQPGTELFVSNTVDLGTGDYQVLGVNTQGVVNICSAGNNWASFWIHQGGTARLGVDDALAASSSLVIGNVSNNADTAANYQDVGTLDLAGTSQTITSLDGYPNGGTAPNNATDSDRRRITSSSARAATLTVGISDGTGSFDGVIENGSGGGTVALTKVGTGTLTLAGNRANTYTGITTVEGGTLSLNKTAGTNAVAGDIVIGAGNLQHDQPNQIADTATVTMTAATSKWLLNGKSETVANMDIRNAGAGATTGFSTGWSGKLTVTETLTHTLGNITLNSSGSGATITADTLVNRGGTWTFGVGSGTQSLKIGPGGLTIGGGSTIVLDANASCTNFISLAGDVTSETHAATNTISGAGRLLLNGPRAFAVADGAAPVDLAVSAIIADGAAAGAVTKAGPGTLSLSGAGANTYTGITAVDGGTLSLKKPAGTNAVAGDIVIGTGILRHDQNDQIADTATVTMTAATSKWLLNGKSETVANMDIQNAGAGATTGFSTGSSGKLTVTDTLIHTKGDITLNSSGSGATITADTLVNRGGTWTFGVLSATQSLQTGAGGLTIGGGSTINVNANASCANFIALGGDVTSEAHAASNTISGAGRLLLNGPRAFAVADGAADVDLAVSAVIADGAGAGSVTKTGPGTLSLSGAGANTYTGITAVDGGTLSLNKTAGTNAVAGDIVIGAGLLQHDQPNQIADTATVTMTAATSKWLLNGKSETVANMDIRNAGAGATTGFSTGWSGKLTVTETLTHTLGNITLNSSGSGATITANTLVNRGGTWTFGSSSGTQSLKIGPGGLTLGGGSTIALDANASCMNFIALGGNITSEAHAATNTISGAGRLLLNGSRVFDVADGAAPVDLAVSAVIADGTGVGSITKTGPGTLSLSGANTFTGGITVNEGTLAVSSLTPLPGWDTLGLYKIGNNGTLAVDNNIADGDVATILESVDFEDGAYICFDTSSGNRTYGQVIGDTAKGALGVYKVGLNTLTLSGNNTYNGNTFVMLGTLYATHNHALGTANGYTAVYATGHNTNGARLAIGPNVTTAEPFILTGPGDGNGGYSPALYRTGGGTSTLGGPITLASQGKRFRINADGGNLVLNGPVGLASGVTGCSLTSQTQPGTELFVSNTVDLGTGDYTVLGINTQGVVNICSAGNNWAYLWIQQGGTARLGVDDALPTNKRVRLGWTTGQIGTLDLAGVNQTVGGLEVFGTALTLRNNVISNSAPARFSTLTVNQAAGASSTFSGRIAGAVNLVKAGAANSQLLLTDVNELSGTATVAGGKLVLDGAAGSLGASCTNVVVNAGTLTVRNSSAIANRAVLRVAAGGGAKVELAAGVNEAIGNLHLNGVIQSAGTYGSASSAATHKNDAFFSGTGVLTVLYDTVTPMGVDDNVSNEGQDELVNTHADSDADEMKDVWELNQGFNPANPADAALDADDDGFTNLQEYVADTDPHDRLSLLRVIDIVLSGDDVSIVWIGGAQSWQRLECKSALAPADGQWDTLLTIEPPTLTTNRFTHDGAASRTGLFYRVRAWR